MARKLAAILFLFPLVLTLASCEQHDKKSSHEKRMEKNERQENVPEDSDD